MLSNPEASGFTVEPFAVPTADGVVLQATLLTPTRGNPRGTILMLHGISARKEQNLAIATRLVSAGYRCILYDSRAHGESGGEFVSYGWREVADAQAVIDAAIAQFEQPEQPLAPFGLFGRSLGASVGLQLLPEEPRLQSAVLVSPFSRLEDVMAETAAPYLGRWGAAAVLPLVSGVMRWRTGGFESGWEQGFELGFNPGAIAPVAAAAQVDVPVLLIHGQADEVILPHHSERNYRAIAHPDKTRRFIPAATHQDVLAVGGEALNQDIVAFYQRTLID